MMPPLLIDLIAERTAARQWLLQQRPGQPRDFRLFSVQLTQLGARFRQALQAGDDDAFRKAAAGGIDSADGDTGADPGAEGFVLAFEKFREGALDLLSIERMAFGIVAETLAIRIALYLADPAAETTRKPQHELADALRRYKVAAIAQLWAWRHDRSKGLGQFEQAADARRDVYRSLIVGQLANDLAAPSAAPRPEYETAVARQGAPVAARMPQRPISSVVKSAITGPITRERVAAINNLRHAAGDDDTAAVRSLIAEAHLRFSAASYDRAHHFALAAEEIIAAAPAPIESDLVAKTRMVRIRSAGRRGSADEAMSVIRTALTETPGNHLLYLRAAELLWPREPARALAFLQACRSMRRTPHVGDHLLMVHILALLERREEAEVEAYKLLSAFPQASDALLLLSNTYLGRGEIGASVQMVDEYFRRFNLPPPIPESATSPVLVRTARCHGLESTNDGPLVTIVMTAFNAADTIGYAIESILNQTHRNLELIVVDDVSEDATRTIVERYAAADGRVKLLANGRNSGTYVSKNRGIVAARGAYISLHDADDWAHPQKIRAGLEVLETRSSLVGVTSQWFRQDTAGHVLMSRWQPSITHLNPASTFFRREVLDQIGYFDSVRVGADSEFLSRMRLHYGVDQVFSDPRPLAIGLHHEMSLTQSGTYAFDVNRYSPVRAAYAEGWINWHDSGVADTGSLILSSEPGERPFDIPESIDVPR